MCKAAVLFALTMVVSKSGADESSSRASLRELEAATRVRRLQDAGAFEAFVTDVVDTELRSTIPDDPFARDQTYVYVRNGDDGDVRQALLQFDLDGITSVTSATLEVGTVDGTSDAVFAHRMLAPWSEASTWRDFGGDGVQANGIEALATPSFTIATAALSRVVELDVTADVALWLSGAVPNYGWVFRMDGADAWAFNAVESNLLPPTLVVRSTDPLPTPAPTPRPGVDRVRVVDVVDTQIRSDDPDRSFAGAVLVSVLQSELGVSQGLVKFDLASIARIPAIAPLHDAKLEVLTAVFPTTPDTFSGTVRAYPMLRDWNASATWTTFGGDGIQPDGVEASTVASFQVSEAGWAVVEIIDVTADVRRWLDGEPNHGWVLIIDQNPGFVFTAVASGLWPPVLDVGFGTPRDPSTPPSDGGSKDNKKKGNNRLGTTTIALVAVVALLAVLVAVLAVLLAVQRRRRFAPTADKSGAAGQVEISDVTPPMHAKDVL
mmetsp:Transcript_17816/g.71463  ORF Transcript_17816/g.71463 Transcript_17816/m.71463 type:complete len:491 (-) Transcript_17816:248-1720(-)